MRGAVQNGTHRQSHLGRRSGAGRALTTVTSAAYEPDENQNVNMGGPHEVYIERSFDPRETHDCTHMNWKSVRTLKKDAEYGLGPQSCHSFGNTSVHSSKEKSRRKRIRECYDQLRALLPHMSERKTDAASVLEATVTYMRSIHDRIPQSVTSQIVKKLQSNNKRFFMSEPVHRSQSPLKYFMEQRDICSIHQCGEEILATGMSSEWLVGQRLQAISNPQDTFPEISKQKVGKKELHNFLFWSDLMPSADCNISKGIIES